MASINFCDFGAIISRWSIFFLSVSLGADTWPSVGLWYTRSLAEISRASRAVQLSWSACQLGTSKPIDRRWTSCRQPCWSLYEPYMWHGGLAIDESHRWSLERHWTIGIAHKRAFIDEKLQVNNLRLELGSANPAIVFAANINTHFNTSHDDSTHRKYQRSSII